MTALAVQIDRVLDVLYAAAQPLIQSLTDPAAIEAASLSQRAGAVAAISRFIAILHKYQAVPPAGPSAPAGAKPLPAPRPAASAPAPAVSAAAHMPGALPAASKSASFADDIARFAAADRAAAAKLGLNYPERFFDPSKDPARNLVPVRRR